MNETYAIATIITVLLNAYSTQRSGFMPRASQASYRARSGQPARKWAMALIARKEAMNQASGIENSSTLTASRPANLPSTSWTFTVLRYGAKAAAVLATASMATNWIPWSPERTRFQRARDRARSGATGRAVATVVVPALTPAIGAVGVMSASIRSFRGEGGGWTVPPTGRAVPRGEVRRSRGARALVATAAGPS